MYSNWNELKALSLWGHRDTSDLIEGVVLWKNSDNIKKSLIVAILFTY